MPRRKIVKKVAQEPTTCAPMDHFVRQYNEERAEIVSLVRDVHADMQWLKSGIRVNGSAGLEPVLKDLHQRGQDNASAIGELKEITHDLRLRRQAQKAIAAWMGAHPRLRVLVDEGWKKAVMIVLALLAAYFGLAEL